jgi:hypothetical protein
MLLGEGVSGIQIDGQTGPHAMAKSLGGQWGVTFYFGKTKAGRVRIASIVVEHGRGDGIVPDDGVTIALLDRVKIGTVRRYLRNLERWPVQPKPTQKRPRGRPAKLNAQELRRLLGRYDRLVAAHDPHPAKTLALETDQNHSNVRTWLARARRLG